MLLNRFHEHVLHLPCLLSAQRWTCSCLRALPSESARGFCQSSRNSFVCDFSTHAVRHLRCHSKVYLRTKPVSVLHRCVQSRILNTCSPTASTAMCAASSFLLVPPSFAAKCTSLLDLAGTCETRHAVSATASDYSDDSHATSGTVKSSMYGANSSHEFDSIVCFLFVSATCPAERTRRPLICCRLAPAPLATPGRTPHSLRQTTPPRRTSKSVPACYSLPRLIPALFPQLQTARLLRIYWK